MDIHFIECKVDLDLPTKNFDKVLKKINKPVGIITIIQYLDITKKIVTLLQEKNINIILGKSDKIPYKTVVLGCDVSAAEKISNKVNSFLFIGDGLFHPIEVFKRTKKKVIVYNPLSGDILELKDDFLESFNKKIKNLFKKFLISKKVGIITSIKPGQVMLKEIEKLKEILKKMDKEIFLFLADNIENNLFLNFPDIEFWIIAACPRLIDDILNRNIKNAITIQDLLQFLNLNKMI